LAVKIKMAARKIFWLVMPSAADFRQYKKEVKYERSYVE